MSPISIIINWSGPYTFDEASELEKHGCQAYTVDRYLSMMYRV